jgi:hypothetical protein
MSTGIEDRQLEPIAADVTTQAAGELPRGDGNGRRRLGLLHGHRYGRPRWGIAFSRQRLHRRAEATGARAPDWLNAEGIDVLDIEVTQADVDQGRRCLPSLCMVAVAARRQLGLLDRRHYAWTRAWDDRRIDNRLSVGSLSNDDRWLINYQGGNYLLPRDVSERIVAWDVGSPVEPFRFRAVRLSERR